MMRWACAARLKANSRLISSKRILDPFNTGLIERIEQNTIEAAHLFAVFCQPMPGGLDDAALLGRGNAGRSTTIMATAAQPHLDEHQRFAIAADQVDLAAANTKVFLQHRQTVARQILRGEIFGFSAALARNGVAPENAVHE